MLKSLELPNDETRPVTQTDPLSEIPLDLQSKLSSSYDGTEKVSEQTAARRITRTIKMIASKRNIRKELGLTKYSVKKRPSEARQKRSAEATQKRRRLLEGAELDAQEVKEAMHFAEEFNVFMRFMRPLSGVKSMIVMTKGDQKILFIGEIHVNTFCTKYNFRPLAQFIEGILEQSEQPIDFMLEERNYSHRYLQAAITDAREIANSRENRPDQHHKVTLLNIDLLRRLVRQYIPYEKMNLEEKHYEVKVLPNARVHWLEAEYVHGKRTGKMTKGDSLIDALYSFIHLMFPPGTMAVASQNTKYLEEHLKTITTIIGFTDDSFMTDEVFLQSTDETLKMFLRKIMNTLASSKFFKNCFSGSRRLSSADYYKCVLDEFERVNARRGVFPRFYFVFYLQRFLVDVFAVCRIVKKDPRWYKNIVVYAGMAHIDNIRYMLQENFYKTRDIPPRLRKDLNLIFNPRCEEM